MAGKTTIVDIYDIKNYKKCRKKKYNVWACAPLPGTCVLNRIEQAGACKKLRRDYFTLDSLRTLEAKNPALAEQIRTNGHMVDAHNRFVISGTMGEMTVIDAGSLAQNYTFDTGEAIDNTSLHKRGKEVNGVFEMDWCLLEAKVKQNVSQYACFVPVKQQFQIKTAWGAVISGNSPDVKHGKGDFIVCSVGPDGKPNLQDMQIVNGLIFWSTYNNQNWTQCLAPQVGKDGKEVVSVKPTCKLINDKSRAILKKVNKEPVADKKPIEAQADKPTAPVQKPMTTQADKPTAPVQKQNALEKLVDKKPVATQVDKPIAPVEKPVEKNSTVKDEVIRRPLFKITGRYLYNGKPFGWHLACSDKSRSGRYTDEQVAFLVGRRDVVNCAGIGIDSYTEEAGVKKANGIYFKDKEGNKLNVATYTLGQVASQQTEESKVKEDTRAIIIGVCKNGKVTTGYIVKNSAGIEKYFDKSVIIAQAKAGNIKNAKVSTYNGKDMLRAVDGQPAIGSLPLMDEQGNVIGTQSDKK